MCCSYSSSSSCNLLYCLGHPIYLQSADSFRNCHCWLICVLLCYWIPLVLVFHLDVVFSSSSSSTWNTSKSWAGIFINIINDNFNTSSIKIIANNTPSPIYIVCTYFPSLLLSACHNCNYHCRIAFRLLLLLLW